MLGDPPIDLSTSPDDNGPIYRTMLVLDARRHRVSEYYELALVTIDEHDIQGELVDGLSVDPTERQEQLDAYTKPPIGFIVFPEDVVFEKDIKINQLPEGMLHIEGSQIPLKPTAYYFKHFNENGQYKFSNPGDNSQSLTVGACISINKIMRSYGEPYLFPGIANSRFYKE